MKRALFLFLIFSSFQLFSQEKRVLAWGSNFSGQLGNGYSFKIPHNALISRIAKISAGMNFSLALREDGTLWEWGGVKNYPVEILNLSNIVDISTGSCHFLALKNDGTVWAWGNNYFGQLGDGTKEDKNIPVQVLSLENVIAISAGHWHSLALKADGTVWAWGYNRYGQLGDGTYVDKTLPVKVLNLEDVIEISGGGFHSLALKNDGTVWAWGDNRYAQLANENIYDSYIPIKIIGLDGVIKISAGGGHSLVIKIDRTVWGWGDNSSGQVGDGSSEIYVYEPKKVQNLEDVVSISAGGNSPGGEGFSIALKEDGTVWAWGANNNYQLGDGTNEERRIPFQTKNLSEIVAISAGLNHSLGLKNDGTVLEWGGDCHNFGDGEEKFGLRDVPISVFGLDDVISVSAGGSHSVALKEDGTVWAWGDNTNGQLGNGTYEDKSFPVQVLNLENVISISAGDMYNLALKADGTVWAWGNNKYGQLGDGTYENKNIPVQVLNLENVVSISAGAGHSLALKEDGTVWAWGSNICGQLGDGTYEDKNIPVNVLNLKDVISVSSNFGHSLALKKDGSVWEWGFLACGIWDYLGEIEGSKVPVQRMDLNNIVSIATGWNRNLALKADGTVWTWGVGLFDFLGTSECMLECVFPVKVENLKNIKEVFSTLGLHSFAIDEDGNVWGWGLNQSGQLGDGTNDGISLPVQIPNLKNLKKISAGGGHSISIGEREDCSIVVLSPKGGENLYKGSTFEVNWSFNGFCYNDIRIDLIKGDEVLYEITNNTKNSGKFLWEISPSTFSGNDYKIKIIDKTNRIFYGFSEDFFEIKDQQNFTFDFLIPAGAHKEGGYNSFWTTDLYICNFKGEQQDIKISILKENENNLNAINKYYKVLGKDCLYFFDLFYNEFKYEGAGAIKISSNTDELSIYSRTYDLNEDETYGPYIRGYKKDELIKKGELAYLKYLVKDERYRTNIGFSSLSDIEINIKLEIYNKDLEKVCEKEVNLPPFGFKQLVDIFSLCGIEGNIFNPYAIISSQTDGAYYFAYSSVIENDTNDFKFFPFTY